MSNFRSFIEYLKEAAEPKGGILHIEHPSDLTFDGKSEAHRAYKTLVGTVAGKVPVTRKIDDKMSFQVKRDEEGRVAVKYKGSGSQYNYSHTDIERQHKEKPYLAAPLKSLLSHADKVLPKRAGEYQGGFMSTPETRKETKDTIEHTPNTITYSVKKNTPEGKKLAKSKVSMAIHTELKGASRTPHPIVNQSEFHSHPDVHLVDHTVSKEEQKLSPGDKKVVMSHLSSAKKMMKDHDYSHLTGHETHLRTYVNSTLDTGEKPSVEGYKKNLSSRWQKEIDKVKTEKAKGQKAASRDAALAHVEKNKEAFGKSFELHHHIQQATNALAQSLNRKASGGYTHRIGEKESGPEGFVAGGLKIVDRHEFSKANRARTALLKGKK